MTDPVRPRAPQFGGDGFTGHRARKRFSQNFLVDRGVIERIVAAIAPRPGERIVEIGPGRGAITELLIESGCDLTVIEIDRDLAHGLRVRHPDLAIVDGDALKVDYGALFDDDAPYRVVGNLPYNISTPLLFRLLDHAAFVSDAHFMLQDEVVQRLGAGPGEKAWGRLGVMVQYRCGVERLFGVSQDAFAPRPQVRSRIVRLEPFAELPCPARDERTFEHVVRAAFSQRRKTLRNGMRTLPGEAAPRLAALEAAGVDLGVRPETLGVEAFVGLANALTDAGLGVD
ncbi:MAG TPA: 16S rRNA (adenine(1518)-N(6)/adenine(1519)-N(6))-dimethyltransferase RsmA [Pseudomonadales bacterium]|nr:16S rRNA (adenine(1518)-N(6)/adenine(1519)-N(6))-dimethyltransferase RsmA [Pseudomonadales bacterium]